MRNGRLIRLLGHVQAALSVARGICGNSQKRNRRRPGSELGFRLGVTLWQQASWQQASWQRASWRLAFSRARPRP